MTNPDFIYPEEHWHFQWPAIPTITRKNATRENATREKATREKALDNAYRACLNIASRSGSNFYRSFYLLRPDRRRGMFSLYAFARLADDWGDDTIQASDPNQAIAWHAWIDTCYGETLDPHSLSIITPKSPLEACSEIHLALAETIDRFTVPSKLLHELVNGVSSDLTGPIIFRDREQLEQYCYQVASTVGLVCLNIWGGNQADVQPSAIDCGIAFQLTNILRDVLEDSRRGRIYVPLDLLLAHQVDPVQWKMGRPNGDWKAVLQTLIEWAQAYFNSGRSVQKALDIDGQRMFSLIWETYRRLLDRIAENLDSVWERRIQLTSFEKASLFLQHAITPCFQKFPSRYLVDD